MKLVHAIFLGQPANSPRSLPCRQAGTVHGPQEIGPSMWIPTVTLAALCVLFGVFAYAIPLNIFIFPSIKEGIQFSGVWTPGLATILIFIGIAVGFVIYLLGTITKTRESEGFVGGEDMEAHPDMRVSGVEFYNTVKDISPLKGIYGLAEKKAFDIYEVGGRITGGVIKVLRYVHNGVLPSYLSWCLLGMIVLFYMLLR